MSESERERTRWGHWVGGKKRKERRSGVEWELCWGGCGVVKEREREREMVI